MYAKIDIRHRLEAFVNFPLPVPDFLRGNPKRDPPERRRLLERQCLRGRAGDAPGISGVFTIGETGYEFQ